ncbi:LysE family translocator [Marinobacter zhejiangensis]|uniref:Threonine/homoserine/homoserine lactone efflux protein n=1 Tax=Marinobacter zhejiangensis TaxID=488535 RepID=A0A1I4LL77_9GAMM|nr:LysE family translocator [Marinobacter zhejiangensis]SFL91858.1 Threonine/homoserine/homoserine lactone efflux protein [Marinobacter zhejiangensis]
MSLSMILPMSAFALAASISPGPVNLMCLSSGTRYRLSQGLIFVTGATLGFIALFIAVGMGLYSLLALVPGLQDLLRWGGVAFLLYLSYRLAFDNGELSTSDSSQAPGFMTGALMQWLNPKAWLASASGIAAYTDGNNLSQVTLFASVYLPICWLSLGTWVYAGAFLRRYVQRPVVLRSVNRILAVLLAASCLYLVDSGLSP